MENLSIKYCFKFPNETQEVFDLELDAQSLELHGLEKIYNNMHVINTAIAERLRVASKTDALVNAIILLDMFTGTIPSVIEESLEELRYLFNPYLENKS